MTAVVDLPTQIAALRRALDHLGWPELQAPISSLEWLARNEARIKAKVEPTQFPSETSGRTYTQKFTGHIDFARGCWQSSYEVFDDTGALIGFKHVGKELPKGPVTESFEPYGSQTFDNSKAFIAAYERGEWKGRAPVNPP